VNRLSFSQLQNDWSEGANVEYGNVINTAVLINHSLLRCSLNVTNTAIWQK